MQSLLLHLFTQKTSGSQCWLPIRITGVAFKPYSWQHPSLWEPDVIGLVRASHICIFKRAPSLILMCFQSWKAPFSEGKKMLRNSRNGGQMRSLSLFRRELRRAGRHLSSHILSKRENTVTVPPLYDHYGVPIMDRSRPRPPDLLSSSFLSFCPQQDWAH